MEFRLFRIERPRLQVAIMVEICRRNRLVVADFSEAAERRLDDLVAVDEVLHSLDEVPLAARLQVHANVEIGIVARGGFREHEAVALGLDQAYGARIDRSGEMDVP
ncbi:hypothetical protein D9M70_493550 [compost metagenome]